MSSMPIFTSTRRPDPVPRLLSAAALLVSLLALVFSMGGAAPAKKGGGGGALVRLDKHGKIPARYLPAVKFAKQSKRLGNATKKDLTVNCPIPDAVDLGTWCLESGLNPVPPKDTGKNDFVYAAQKCVREGGWLPTAAQLIGAAPKVKLQSKIDDSPLTSGVDEFATPKNGIKDAREMSGDLTTTTAGGRAAGSEGVTVGSKGNGNLGEPDPVPMPADPLPDTLNYITVYDNYNHGGFAGGAPVGAPEKFRCAYAKGSQGTKFGD
ncbi:MAG TPA: hypothetical protein VHQ43_06485 [Solirubrobacterales bacterium]|jgi:hypothetical protein|nr:hypothetical protein [Solirubrobacterales bacterium]